jgi:acyl-ACP thioesterase
LSASGTHDAEGLVPIPAHGRTYSSTRRIRLSDTDATGRLRLDSVARYLQDIAIEDVDETGWGLPEHLWFIRSIRVDVLVPFLDDEELELVTWCSGVAPVAAGRRWSLSGDRGGRIEVDSVWIHLGPDERPARLDGFGIYAEATGGRRVSTRLVLPDPPQDAGWARWPVRVTDIDRHGHVNNASYWQGVEERLIRRGPDPAQPFRAFLEYREPTDVDDEVSLAEWGDGMDVHLAFVTTSAVKAVARLLPVTGARRRR